MDRKLDCRRGQINALGGLVYLHDSKTKEKFLVDTGAAVSVFPHTSKDPSTGPPLSGADGKSIPSWGSIKKTLNFGVRAFLSTFILAAVSKPILGVDFLSENRLLVDPHFGQVLDAKTLDPITGSESAARRAGLAASLCHVTPAVLSLLAAFPAIVGDGSCTPNPKHGVFHSIETSGRPVFAKPRHLDPEKHQIAETWRRPGSYADPILHGLHHCTWSQRRTGLGVHTVITADSIWPQSMTATPCPPSWICQLSFTAANFSPSLT
jgi:hypothetical protein